MSDINPSATTAAQDSRTSIRLEAGLTAPDFTLPSDNGDSVTLSALRGQNIILYFYPAAMTPGCTTEACDFRDQDPAFTASGAVIIGVSPDSVRTHQGFKGKHALPFLLLSDPGNVVAQRYGAFGEKVLYGRRSQGVIRSTFVIDLTQGSARLSALYRKVAVKGHASAVLEAVGTGKGAAPR